MACRFHNRRLPAPLLRQPSAPTPSGSVVKQSPAWFETQSLLEPRPAGSVRYPGTTPPADTAAKRWADSNSKCSPTNSRPPDSCPVCPLDRSTVEPLPQNAFPALETPCHRRSMPPRDRVSAWSAAPPAAHAPASLRRSRARPPRGGAATGACGEHYPEPSAPPSARRSCALPATTIPCSSSSGVRADRRAPRRWPGPRDMPRSASVVGLAKRGVIPQNNSTPQCSFLTQ